jgi:hypothetical protein
MNGNRDQHASDIQLDGQLSAKNIGYQFIASQSLSIF